MSWNYRVMRDRNPDGSFWFAIREVYYDDKGQPNGWTENPSWPMGDTFKEFTQDVANYQRAVGQSILAVEANGNELYDIGGMGNRRKPVLVWKRESAPSVNAGATPSKTGAKQIPTASPNGEVYSVHGRVLAALDAATLMPSAAYVQAVARFHVQIVAESNAAHFVMHRRSMERLSKAWEDVQEASKALL